VLPAEPGRGREPSRHAQRNERPASHITKASFAPDTSLPLDPVESLGRIPVYREGTLGCPSQVAGSGILAGPLVMSTYCMSLPLDAHRSKDLPRRQRAQVGGTFPLSRMLAASAADSRATAATVWAAYRERMSRAWSVAS
jgi:hypothetical protein